MLSFPIVHLQGVSSMKKQLLVAAALIAFASSGMAQDKHTQITPDAVIWKDNPAFPKGVQIATLFPPRRGICRQDIERCEAR